MLMICQILGDNKPANWQYSHLGEIKGGTIICKIMGTYGLGRCAGRAPQGNLLTASLVIGLEKTLILPTPEPPMV